MEALPLGGCSRRWDTSQEQHRHYGDHCNTLGRATQTNTSSLPALGPPLAPRRGGPQVFCWAAPEQGLPVRWAVMHNNTQQTGETGRQGAESEGWGGIVGDLPATIKH